MPKVTVTMPSYNHEAFIAEAIQSVLNQTFQDFEILIVDDCSTDNSVDIIKSFKDPRITLIVNSKNKGVCYGHNLMIKLAKGEYIAVINSDDVWEPFKLEEQVNFLDNNANYGAVFSNVEFIREDGSIFDSYHGYDWFNSQNKSRYEWLRSFFYLENHLAHPTAVIRREAHEEVGNYNLLIALSQDYHLWIRLCLKYEIYVLPKKLTKFRILDGDRNGSATNIKNVFRFAFESNYILNNFLLIKEFSTLIKIFPEVQDYIKPGSAIEDIPLLLGLVAIQSNNSLLHNWGIKILYEALSEGTRIDHFDECYGITPVFLHKLISQLYLHNTKYNISVAKMLKNKIYNFIIKLRKFCS